MIVGTAGHIDHGKTTLVKAMTGVDTDRLAEEKRRGISIELGYAFLDTPAGARIGFIDVPGHERLVHTMLAGATGIDFAMLVVAADDGVMPQTREHLAILSLLGLHRGVVAITKSDRVDVARVAAVASDAAALLRDTTLAGAPSVPVSALRGEGLSELAALLFEAARADAPVVDDAAAFRLAIDRVFSLDGVGTVVTGTAHAGCVRAGDELVLLPGGRRVRVRSVHAQNRAVDQARAGERCALGLTGIPRHDVARGQWLAAPLAALCSDRLDASISLWHAESRPLRSGTPVTVHLGTAAVPGSVALLDAETLAPGRQARVQIVLKTPTAAWHGERIILRDASASRTIAGGTVLDPFAPARYRRTPQRLAELDALALPDERARAAAVVGAAPRGVDWQQFCAAQGRDLPVPEPAMIVGGRVLGPAHAAAARGSMLWALSAFHEHHPHEFGPDVSRLRRLALPQFPDPAFRALLAELRAQRAVVVKGARVQLPAHAVSLSADDQRALRLVEPLLRKAGFAGAWVRDLAREAGVPEPWLRSALSRLTQASELHQVAKDLFCLPEPLRELARIAQELSAGQAGELTAARLRDAAGLGRNRTIQILEYFDRIGMLRRVGDVHKPRSDCTLFADEVDRN